MSYSGISSEAHSKMSELVIELLLNEAGGGEADRPATYSPEEVRVVKKFLREGKDALTGKERASVVSASKPMELRTLNTRDISAIRKLSLCPRGHEVDLWKNFFRAIEKTLVDSADCQNYHPEEIAYLKHLLETTYAKPFQSRCRLTTFGPSKNRSFWNGLAYDFNRHFPTRMRSVHSIRIRAKKDAPSRPNKRSEQTKNLDDFLGLQYSTGQKPKKRMGLDNSDNYDQEFKKKRLYKQQDGKRGKRLQANRNRKKTMVETVRMFLKPGPKTITASLQENKENINGTTENKQRQNVIKRNPFNARIEMQNITNLANIEPCDGSRPEKPSSQINKHNDRIKTYLTPTNSRNTVQGIQRLSMEHSPTGLGIRRPISPMGTTSPIRCHTPFSFCSLDDAKSPQSMQALLLGASISSPVGYLDQASPIFDIGQDPENESFCAVQGLQELFQLQMSPREPDSPSSIHDRGFEKTSRQIDGSRNRLPTKRLLDFGSDLRGELTGFFPECWPDENSEAKA